MDNKSGIDLLLVWLSDCKYKPTINVGYCYWYMHDPLNVKL